MSKCFRDWFRRTFTRKPKLTDDLQWEAWRELIKRIYQETVYAFKNRMIWREVYRIYEANQRLQNDGVYFLEWMRGVYGRDQAMAIRREADRGSDVLNLIQLMYQISKRPEVISRARYKAHFPPDTVIPEFMQDGQFDELCGNGKYIDVARVKKDYKRLLKDCRPVVNYVNKRIAHRTDVDVDLTMQQIHTAMDAVEEILKKYYVILTGASLMQAEPAVQFDWQRVFTFPWIPLQAEE